MHTLYYVTNNDRYRRMTIFFGKLFLINFALGLVTGITQEFQFGMNWSEYSRSGIAQGAREEARLNAVRGTDYRVVQLWFAILV